MYALSRVTCVFQVISFSRIYRSIQNIDDSCHNNFAKLFRCETSDSLYVCDVRDREERKRETKARATRSKSEEGKNSREPFHGSANKNAQKITGTVVCHRFLRLHISRVPVVPVETYHCMKSSCRCDSRSAATNGNCSWFPNIFLHPRPPRCDMSAISPLRFILFAYPSVSA